MNETQVVPHFCHEMRVRGLDQSLSDRISGNIHILGAGLEGFTECGAFFAFHSEQPRLELLHLLGHTSRTAPMVVLLALLLVVELVRLHSRTIFVDNNRTQIAPEVECGLTLETACPTIYAGFLAASSSDTILLAPGTYSGKGNEALTSVNLTVISLHLLGNGPQAAVIIQCLGDLRFLYARDNFLEAISNVTIRNCSSLNRRVFLNQDGGGLLVTASPLRMTITDTTFEQNSGFNGGAVSVTGGSLSLIRCTFLQNRAGYWGGAVQSADSSLTVSGSVFIGNTASGDLIVDSNIVIDIDTTEAGRGGGIYANGGSRMTVRASTFLTNSARVAGGALHLRLLSGLDIDSCEFIGNSASGGQDCRTEGLCAIRGGALFVSDIALYLTNCNFLGNEAITSHLTEVLYDRSRASTRLSSDYVL
jgi:predicted outer membrane repeat protein